MKKWRYHLALLSYWVLFILLPMGALIVWLGASASNLAAYLIALVVLVVIGERGFRSWKRICRVD